MSVADINIPKGASGNTDTIGWGVQIPDNGVSGDCSGTISISPT